MEVPRRARVVVVGAGIAGISVAHHLVRRLGVDEVVLCDPRPPLSLTSDKSTECYRTWWPNAPMISLMSRSVDLLEQMAEESDNVFRMNRRGYLYVTAAPDRLEDLAASARLASSLGAGPLRVHGRHGGGERYAPSLPEGWSGAPDGADLFLDGDRLRERFPYLTDQAVGGLHARRAGWLSAQQLGAWMLERAKEAGLLHLSQAVSAIEIRNGAVRSVRLGDGSVIEAPSVVDAAGPMLGEVARTVDVDLPIHHEVHLKVGFPDRQGAVPRDAPMLIWHDPQRLGWPEDVGRHLTEEGRHDLTGEMPPACHGRPEGPAESPWVLSLWEYHRQVHRHPVFPLPEDPLYPEVVMRGMSTMIPGLGGYLDGLPPPVVDGGYYTKTVENRPLIGPAGPEGFVVCGALSGFGVMAAAGAGELAALHVAGEPLPDHAPAFLPSRYEDPRYRQEIATVADTGQL